MLQPPNLGICRGLYVLSDYTYVVATIYPTAAAAGGAWRFVPSFPHLNLCYPQMSQQEQILTPRHRRSHLFYYSSHKNFMFLWKNFTTMTENIITDSGRLQWLKPGNSARTEE